MSVVVACPGCRSNLRLPDPRPGMTVKCPQCAHKIIFRDKPGANGTAAAELPADQAEVTAVIEESVATGSAQESMRKAASSVKGASGVRPPTTAPVMAPAAPPPRSDAAWDDEDGAVPAWISPWGAA